MKRAIRYMLSAVALVLFLPVCPVHGAQPSDVTTIPKLLDQVRQHAAQANRDGAILESYTYSPIDFRMYAQTLTNLKAHVQNMFRGYYQLQQMRDRGTPAQQEAIDRLDPLLREVATSLTNTIQELNAEQGRVNMPGFRARVHSNTQKINAVFEFLCKCTNKNVKI